MECLPWLVLILLLIPNSPNGQIINLTKLSCYMAKTTCTRVLSGPKMGEAPPPRGSISPPKIYRNLIEIHACRWLFENTIKLCFGSPCFAREEVHPTLLGSQGSPLVQLYLPCYYPPGGDTTHQWGGTGGKLPP